MWDRIEGDFVERVVEGDCAPCVTLSDALGERVEWAVGPVGRWPIGLRVRKGGALVPLPEEEVVAAREGEARAKAAEAAALARLAEIEARLRERDGP